MVSELLHNEPANPYWALWEISLGTMAGMCCVVFLGLKLRWFRAQLRLGDSPSTNVAPMPVQGVGFKFKSNPDDFQLYNVKSEFPPVTNQNKQKPIQQQNGAQNKNPVISKPLSNSNKTTTMTQSSQSTTSNKSTSLTQVQPKPVTNVPSIATNNKSNISKQQPNSSTTENKISTPKKQAPIKEKTTKSEIKPKQQPNLSTTENKISTPKKQAPIKENTTKSEIKPILKKQEATETKNSTVNFEENHVEIPSPKPKNFSDLINKPLNKNTLTTTDNEQQKTHNNNVVKQPMMQTKNPLAAHKIVMPTENEDDWKIKIVDEKPKQEKREDGMNGYSTPIKSSLYSSQAASIFFGGTAPVPEPRARKFEEMDDDVFSNGSQTSA